MSTRATKLCSTRTMGLHLLRSLLVLCVVVVGGTRALYPFQNTSLSFDARVQVSAGLRGEERETEALLEEREAWPAMGEGCIKRCSQNPGCSVLWVGPTLSGMGCSMERHQAVLGPRHERGPPIFGCRT